MTIAVADDSGTGPTLNGRDGRVPLGPTAAIDG